MTTKELVSKALEQSWGVELLSQLVIELWEGDPDDGESLLDEIEEQLAAKNPELFQRSDESYPGARS